jgi:hypothetical protein
MNTVKCESCKFGIPVDANEQDYKEEVDYGFTGITFRN